MEFSVSINLDQKVKEKHFSLATVCDLIYHHSEKKALEKQQKRKAVGDHTPKIKARYAPLHTMRDFFSFDASLSVLFFVLFIH